MKSLLPSRYQLKKALLWPRTQFMRWRYRDSPESMKAMYELHYYRPAFFRFLAATFVNRNILFPAHLTAESVVIDIGAFTGNWAQSVADLYDSTVYSFEPNPRSFERLAQRSLRNPKLHPLPYGLGDRDEEVDFVLGGVNSTVAFEHLTLDNATPQVRAHLADVKRIWDEFGWGRVDLVKIDVEGAEYDLLDRVIEQGLQHQVRCFLIQFHEWHPAAYARRRKIIRELEKTHRLEWKFDFVWEKWVRL